VPLQEQPFQVLAVLLKRPGELVWIEYLRQQVWPRDTFVEFDQALNTAVKKIRTALGDCANAPCYVETIPKRGYRFVANVTASDDPQTPSVEAQSMARAAPARDWLWRTAARAAIAVTILASLALLGVRWKAGAADPNGQQIALAVLPLEDWSDNSGHLAFCDGVTQELITQLGRVSPWRLTVAPRAATLPYRHTTKTVAEVARELHANYLLEGNLRGGARHVRVTMELIRVHDEALVWGDSFDRETGDSLSLETELAATITAKLTPVLLPNATQQR
jgi:TolB-like protein/DNA-binding winged helix-turn-helix (wHTH) protein